MSSSGTLAAVADGVSSRCALARTIWLTATGSGKDSENEYDCDENVNQSAFSDTFAAIAG